MASISPSLNFRCLDDEGCAVKGMGTTSGKGAISQKTASLFSLAMESGAILSQAPESSIEILKEYGYNLGIAFQIVDDILDFTSTDRLSKKSGGD